MYNTINVQWIKILIHLHCFWNVFCSSFCTNKTIGLHNELYCPLEETGKGQKRSYEVVSSFLILMLPYSEDFIVFHINCMKEVETIIRWNQWWFSWTYCAKHSIAIYEESIQVFYIGKLLVSNTVFKIGKAFIHWHLATKVINYL